MNENKKIKVSILRLLAFSLVLCLLAVLVFGFSEALFDSLQRRVDPTSDDTKNTRWVLNQAENLLLFPVLALAGLLYRKRDDAYITATHYKEKKIAFCVLLVFMYCVLMPYYISQNIAGNMSVFDALGDKTIWFATQLIFISALIMYHSDSQSKLMARAQAEEEENE